MLSILHATLKTRKTLSQLVPHSWHFTDIAKIRVVSLYDHLGLSRNTSILFYSYASAT